MRIFDTLRHSIKTALQLINTQQLSFLTPAYQFLESQRRKYRGLFPVLSRHFETKNCSNSIIIKRLKSNYGFTTI